MRVLATAVAAAVVVSAAWMTSTFAGILGADGFDTLDLVHSLVFAPLALWLAQAFWVPLCGAVRRIGRPRPPERDDGAGRIAMVVPIYNENAYDVFARVAAIAEEIAAAGLASRSDVFVLSDTTSGAAWLDELECFERLRRARLPVAVYYRRRLRNVRRKVGNIDDFLGRWGGHYAYMLVLDADSLMTGDTVAAMVRRMDAAPGDGLLQAPPRLAHGATWFARHLQFGGELAGAITASGVAALAGDCGNYWGHNALIRTAAFAKHAGLPTLKTNGPLGGDIMSHDFVEAALLRRAGWHVRMADDLDGSFEEPPPTVASFLARDRRWCHGNLQHLHVLASRNLHLRSRIHFLVGIASYLSAPLWLAFLVLAGLQGVEQVSGAGPYFQPGSPFPVFPEPVAVDALTLLGVTLGALFAPKVIGLGMRLVRPRRPAGPTRFDDVVSFLLEALVSALLAPVMMLFHTAFVVAVLRGRPARWTPQRRSAEATALGEAFRLVRWPWAIGVATTAAVMLTMPALWPWAVPVVAGPILAPLLVWYLDRRAAGEALRADGLLLANTELAPPRVFARYHAWRRRLPVVATADIFAATVLDPARRDVLTRLVRAEPPTAPPAPRVVRLKAARVGPTALDDAEMKALLEDPTALAEVARDAPRFWPDAVAHGAAEAELVG